MADLSDLFGVKGLIVVVTGGATGIGLMIAQALEGSGAIVYIIGRRQETLVKATKTARYNNIHLIQGDVTRKDDLERAAAELRSKHGYVDVVIANSGIVGPTLDALPKDVSISQLQKHLWNLSSDSFQEVFAVNTTAVFMTVVAFLGLLDEGNKRGGHKQRSQVIATSSVGAYIRLPVLNYAYEASKAGVVHMMKQFTSSLVPYGIRANVLVPGWYPSDMTQEIMKQIEDCGWQKDFVPEERPGDGEDMAGAILFLVSKAGAYINGNMLVTDGGRLGIIPSTY